MRVELHFGASTDSHVVHPDCGSPLLCASRQVVERDVREARGGENNSTIQIKGTLWKAQPHSTVAQCLRSLFSLGPLFSFLLLGSC